jgi:hypothetical protein
MDGLLKGIDIERIHHGTYTEYNVSIDGGVATTSLQKIYTKYLKDVIGMWDADYIVGTSS